MKVNVKGSVVYVVVVSDEPTWLRPAAEPIRKQRQGAATSKQAASITGSEGEASEGLLQGPRPRVSGELGHASGDGNTCNTY